MAGSGRTHLNYTTVPTSGHARLEQTIGAVRLLSALRQLDRCARKFFPVCVHEAQGGIKLVIAIGIEQSRRAGCVRSIHSTHAGDRLEFRTQQTRSLATEVGTMGVTVNAITPGLTVTEGIRDNSAYSQQMRDGVIASRAIAREERAEDLVGICTFLASDAATFITGQITVVDGGVTFH